MSTAHCMHDWVPEPLVFLMEMCTRCRLKRPVESRDRRMGNLLAEAVRILDGAAPLRDGFREELVQASLEMHHRDVLAQQLELELKQQVERELQRTGNP